MDKNGWSVLLLIFALVLIANSTFYSGEKDAFDRLCFCQLEGTVDDCSCDVDTVDHFNNVKVYPVLKSLLVKDFFRFYKVNLKKNCPFWPDDSKCAMKFCHVQMCDQNEIPEGLKGETAPVFKYTRDAQDCTDDLDVELGFLNTSIDAVAQLAHQKWQEHDDNQYNFCIIDEEQDADYVDLLLNPERYTGYKGDSARRVWSTIYLENCFASNKSSNKAVLVPFMDMAAKNGVCLEQRVFYRMVSGLHTSINIHLCANFLMSEKRPTISFAQPSSGLWGPNIDEFERRFSPQTTDGEGPHWLRNLYFAYLVELRALAKIAPYLRNQLYFTGNDAEDFEVRKAVHNLLKIVEEFPSHFNESVMFNGDSGKLKREFREKFMNISRIMDCVGCDKCRLWGKLQTQGMGTALKILFSGNFDTQPDLTNTMSWDDRRFQLKRTEIVSLFNAFGRLSNSIFSLESFRKQLR